MSQKTLVGGTVYEIMQGRTLAGGTGYDIFQGRTLVGGTGYDILFGKQLWEYAVGESVFTYFDGVLIEFIVVQQGNPDSTFYDASCDGTWLLMGNVYTVMPWCNEGIHWVGYACDYSITNIYSYLNNDFLELIDPKIQNIIVQAKIPYLARKSDNTDGLELKNLSAKVFQLSAYEVGWSSNDYSYINKDGACLSFFAGTAKEDTKRIAYYNGETKAWGLRSPNRSGGIVDVYITVNKNGGISSLNDTSSMGVRPAMILPGTTRTNRKTAVIIP